MVGTEGQKGLDNWMYAFRKNYVSSEIEELFAGATDQYMVNDGSASNFARRSYFGRFNYNYNNKYLVEFVARYDGSYMFDDAWGFFPGISAGWRIVDENFWRDNISFFEEPAVSLMAPVWAAAPVETFKVASLWRSMGLATEIPLA